MKKLFIIPAFALVACGTESQDVAVTHYDNGIIAQTTLQPVGSVSQSPREIAADEEEGKGDRFSDRREYADRDIVVTELRLEELRPMGASETSVYRGRLRHGRGQWFMGSTFPYVLASGIFRMRERPYVIGGFLIVVGYLAAALSSAPRYEDPAFRSELRRWQWARMVGLLRGGGVR